MTKIMKKYMKKPVYVGLISEILPLLEKELFLKQPPLNTGRTNHRLSKLDAEKLLSPQEG